MNTKKHLMVREANTGACVSRRTSGEGATAGGTAAPHTSPTRGKEDSVMGKEVDQDRLCCGSLLEAELVDGRILLRCLSCGTMWSRQVDGIFIEEGPSPQPSNN